jgi:RimJ/RimL family protein N-acetyltransferase
MVNVNGRKIILRTALIGDAQFVLDLRTLEHKSQHLSAIENSLEKQQVWLAGYLRREAKGEEFYFIIEDLSGNSLGLVRVYDLRQDSFCWGSWLIKDDAPITTATESALLVYRFGFDILKLPNSHFEVRKKNEKVVKFHLRFGAKITDDDELNFYFNFTYADYQHAQKKYARFIIPDNN